MRRLPHIPRGTRHGLWPDRPLDDVWAGLSRGPDFDPSAKRHILSQSSTQVPTSTSTTGAGHTTTAPTTTATTATTEPPATTTGVPATTTTEPQVSLTPPAPQSHSGPETPTKPSGGGSALAGRCPETRPSYESACGRHTPCRSGRT